MPRKNRIVIWRFIFALLIILIILNILVGIYVSKPIVKKEENKTFEEKKIEKKQFNIPSNGSIVDMQLPAVDSNGKGVVTFLNVKAIPGSGRTLVDIENILFWADTQQSIRMARKVAENISGINVSNYDLIYSIKANASVVGGPSAGAAITLATIFALEGKKPRDDVMITGTINHDGSIGPVSGIIEKAKASKEANATIFLVPLLQSRDVTYETKRHCEKFGGFEICQEETIPKKINVEEKIGIRVIEVGNIKEALGYFTDKF